MACNWCYLTSCLVDFSKNFCLDSCEHAADGIDWQLSQGRDHDGAINGSCMELPRLNMHISSPFEPVLPVSLCQDTDLSAEFMRYVRCHAVRPIRGGSLRSRSLTLPALAPGILTARPDLCAGEGLGRERAVLGSVL